MHRLWAARRRGRIDANAFLETGEIADTLADFGAGGPGEAALRLFLHALHFPPGVLAVAHRLLPARHRPQAVAIAERYAYWTGARRGLDSTTWRRLTRGTAILMYHALGRSCEGASRFVVSARRLEKQLRWLSRRDRPVLALDELVDCLRQGRLPPAGAVVITFDDGYLDTGELAAPLLQRFGFPSTVFATSGYVGAAARWDGAGELSGRPLLDWAGPADLQQGGAVIAAHTRTHPQLPDLDATEAAMEIGQSQGELGERLGTRIRSFAYPYGRTSLAVRELVEEAGFDSACGVDRGLNYAATPLFELRRIEVDGELSMLRFALGVRFGDPNLLASPMRRLRSAVVSGSGHQQPRASRESRA